MTITKDGVEFTDFLCVVIYDFLSVASTTQTRPEPLFHDFFVNILSLMALCG